MDRASSIDGVDGLFVGPADLSQNLGVVGEMMHEKCLAALDKVSAACKKHKKSWGAVSWGNQHAQMLVDKGCRMISPCSDIRILKAGLESVKKEFANGLSAQLEKLELEVKRREESVRDDIQVCFGLHTDYNGSRGLFFLFENKGVSQFSSLESTLGGPAERTSFRLKTQR